MTISIVKVGPGDEARFEELLAIYRASIERSEQKPEAELRRMVSRPECSFLVAERNGAVIAFAISRMATSEDVWLLEYMATLSAERSSGVGRALFEFAHDAAGASRIALVEVDAPGVASATGADAAQPLRFYARLGFREVHGLDYQLPLMVHGAPPPMRILALAPPGETHVSAAQLKRWLRWLYVEVYGESANDPRIDAMVHALPDDVPLMRLPGA